LSQKHKITPSGIFLIASISATINESYPDNHIYIATKILSAERAKDNYQEKRIASNLLNIEISNLARLHRKIATVHLSKLLEKKHLLPKELFPKKANKIIAYKDQ
jgi:hypothetical protein